MSFGTFFGVAKEIWPLQNASAKGDSTVYVYKGRL